MRKLIAGIINKNWYILEAHVRVYSEAKELFDIGIDRFSVVTHVKQ